MSFDDYVRADGTASKDDATGLPDDPSKAMSLTTFNASNFAPGDRISFSDQGGDGFSLDGTAEAIFYKISTQATDQAAGNGPPESDQAITTHGTAKAWVYSFDFRGAESWAVAVGRNKLCLYDGVQRFINSDIVLRNVSLEDLSEDFFLF